MAAAGGVGVGRGDQHAGRAGSQDLQKLVKRDDGLRTMPPAVAAYSVSLRHRSIAARLNASIAASHTATRGRGPLPPGRRNNVLSPPAEKLR